MLSRRACLASPFPRLAFYHDLLALTTPGRRAVNSNGAPHSHLGLRSQRPPDSSPDPRKKRPLTDQEREIRTGQIILVMQETLPDFFTHGLITSIDETGFPNPPPSTSIPSANTNFLEHYITEDMDECIYSPNIRLSYTPPVPLPAPFPKTLQFEGFPLYLASASFVKHTMNAIYSDLTVDVTKMVINTPKGPFLPPDREHPLRQRMIIRDKSFCIRQVINGIGRVSGKPAEWETESTYTFSPVSAMIHEHVVNSIHPAPHEAVYDSLRLSLGKVLGLGWSEGAGSSSPNGAVCRGKIQGGKVN